MGSILTHRDVVNQSNQVWNQFGESKWIPYAQENAKLPRRPSDELRNSGIGKVLVCVAMGESLEGHIEILKQYRDRFDILTCDKGFGALLDHGIKADMVMICDANIPVKWLTPYVDQTEGVKLICTPYANVEWTKQWKGDKYFFVNKDAIRSEKHFLNIFGSDIRVIPASTNVSNAMVVFMTGCDDSVQANWAGYEKYLLTGYDYSWRPGGNYYAWNDPKPKRFYMHNRTMLDIKNDWCFSSENLLFSAKWLYSYVSTFKFLPIINCSGRGLLLIPMRGDMQKEIESITPNPARRVLVRAAFEAAKLARQTYEAAVKMFDKTREELVQWPSAIPQK